MLPDLSKIAAIESPQPARLAKLPRLRPEGLAISAVTFGEVYEGILGSRQGAPDEASIQGNARAKIAALEAIDRDIVGPIAERLKKCGDPEKDPASEGWRLLVLPDHVTSVTNRKHDSAPVPFMIAGAWVRSMVQRGFSEVDASGSDLKIAEGSELMEYFLRGGLRNIRARSK